MRVEDELEKAKALVDKAVKAEAMKQRIVFLMQVWLSEVGLRYVVRTARKGLRVELDKKVWALKRKEM